MGDGCAQGLRDAIRQRERLMSVYRSSLDGGRAAFSGARLTCGREGERREAGLLEECAA